VTDVPFLPRPVIKFFLQHYIQQASNQHFSVLIRVSGPFIATIWLLKYRLWLASIRFMSTLHGRFIVSLQLRLELACGFF
jgi:hypothetical protein